MLPCRWWVAWLQRASGYVQLVGAGVPGLPLGRRTRPRHSDCSCTALQRLLLRGDMGAVEGRAP